MKLSTMHAKWQKGFVLCIWIVIWELVYLGVGKAVLVPSPFDTIKTLGQMMMQPSFYRHIVATFGRVLAGVGLSLSLGFALAGFSYKVAFIERFLKPMVALMKATPIMAIIILALLWFQSNEVPIFVCILMCYPIVYTNLLTGLSALDLELKEMSQFYKVNKWIVLRKCYWPQLRHYVQASLQLGLGMAWKVVIAAEVLALPKYAIGDALLSAKLYIETTKVFAWIIVIVGLSQLCESMVDLLFKRGAWRD
ncbi:MAG: ABC transporter permease subunit [Cellulosilyticum sp.]|nr:ABC transporter permease subunit [Cellulosilyticum sp.]